MGPRLYLASTSRYRAELLSRLGVPFAVESPGVDEAVVEGESPAARAQRLARAKADAVAGRHVGDWVIGSDQVAVVDGRLLEKPGNAARCRQQLRAQSGRSVEFHTAVALCRLAPPASREHVDRTVVRFRALDDAEIARYVEAEAPFDCAGGFRSEGLGAALFDSIETRDPTALIGMPLVWLEDALRAAGFDRSRPAQS